MNNTNNSKEKKKFFQEYLKIQSLVKLEIEPVDFLIDNFLPSNSLALLSARPKAGKTNLALQMAFCLASGRFFLGKKTKKSKILFISLELNKQQMLNRVLMIAKHYDIDLYSDYYQKFKNFPFAFRFSSERKGIEALEKEIKHLIVKHKFKFDVIFVDTYVLFKDISKEAISKHKSTYELESEYLSKIRKFCEEYNVSIVLIYHNRKSQLVNGDITESIMGSTGIAGAVNEIFLLDRKTNENQAKLTTTGHNIKEETIELAFKDGVFSLLTATDKEFLIAEKIYQYLSQVGKSSTNEIFSYLKTSKITSDKPLVISILKKFDVSENQAGYWKCEEEKRKNGRASKVYSLADYVEIDFSQESIEFDEFEDFTNENDEFDEDDEYVDF